MSGRTRPFSNGSQYMDWCERNCLRCSRHTDAPGRMHDVKCDIERALSNAFWDDGSIADDIAERMGALDSRPPRQDGFSYTWDCPEFEVTGEGREGE